MVDGRLIDSTEAATRLRVRPATLYAYASRGLIASEPDPADPRRRRYRASDVEALRRATQRGRARAAIAAGALDWGVAALPSRITLIAGGRLYFRGQDALTLAETAALEDVARLLWEASADPFAETPAARPRGAAMAGPPLDRLRMVLARETGRAASMLGREPAHLKREAAGLLRRLVAAALGTAAGDRPIDRQIAEAWRLDRRGRALVRAALVLLADHELNASTFAVRVVASTGAALPACLGAGLAALSGPRHGGATARAIALLTELGPGRDAAQLVADRLRRGEALPGFGHPLYPAGDPRAAFLLARLPADRLRTRLLAAVERQAGLAPNVDFALAGLVRALRLPAERGLTLFALARSVGWIAHALEQTGEGKLIRPRADYVGPPPITPPARPPRSSPRISRRS